jgi:signal transduction histidine kinase
MRLDRFSGGVYETCTPAKLVQSSNKYYVSAQRESLFEQFESKLSPARMKIYLRSVRLMWLLVVASECCGWRDSAASAESPAHRSSNVAQLKNLSGVDLLVGCNFSLTGVVTLVDRNRDLVVLQDGTGAVALHFPLKDESLQIGQRVTLDGENCCPYFPSFPDYPYHPSEPRIQSSFDSPMDFSEYKLTRMRGLLRPPVTGEYSFWIASDNSSELWLSPNADPSKSRKIASMARFSWVVPHEWTRFPSQRSESIQLKAGEVYYLEALAEQTTGGEHLSVAWQGPGLEQAVIASPYVTPWGTNDSITGVLCEYWTNYTAGDLEGLTGPRVFNSVLTVEKVRVSGSRPDELPRPQRIALNQPLSQEDNYRWVLAEGVVRFTGADGDVAFFELSAGQSLVQVCASHWSPELSKRLRKVPVQVEGVCEGVPDQKGMLVPGRIWTSAERMSFPETVATNAEGSVADQPAQSRTIPDPAMQGFFATRGVVTFNDQVFGNHYVFVQEDSTVIRVAVEKLSFKDKLNPGEGVDLGGALEPGRDVPVITPLVVKELGWRSMPLPVVQLIRFAAPGNLEGRWSELEGVVHSVNTNGTLSIAGKEGTAYLWIGQTPSDVLSRYVDARLRVRGVFMRTLLDAPALLIPSRSFIEMEEEPPANPYQSRRRSIADLFSESADLSSLHRARVIGEVTYVNADSFFLQDASGGVRVRASDQPTLKVGDIVEVLAFPSMSGFAGALTEVQLRPASGIKRITARDLDLSDALSPRQNGALVQVSATLLAKKTNGIGAVLELQERQRVFTAALAAGNLPDLTVGSRVQVTGVCDDEAAAMSPEGEKSPRAQLLSSLNILLRSPQDVKVLSGPPWWTLRRTATLVGTLLMVLLITLLWVHLLRRRLERQQAAQLAFSQDILKRVEDERRRIAANLHDSLGQVLVAIKNHALMAIQQPADGEQTQNRLNEISNASSQAIEEVRQITHGLRPYQLDRLGLTQAIRASIDQVTADNSIAFASRVENVDGLFSQDAEIHIYRILQEAVTNVVKHSAATEAAVAVTQRPGVILLSIRDNGRGFEPSNAAAHEDKVGYGLSGMAERVRILGATLVIDSSPGCGTSLTVEVPLPIQKP